MGGSDHVFLYRHRSLRKDLIPARLKATGQRVGVKVSAHRLLETFLHAPSIETKNNIANWIKEMEMASVLRKLHDLRQPTEEDLKILKKYFPISEELKKIGKMVNTTE